MKHKRMKLIQLFVLGLLLIAFVFPSQVLADDDEPDNPYYQVHSVILEDGTVLDETIIAGPPEPPPGFDRNEVNYLPPNLPPGVNVIPNVPAFDWSFGCSATSASMIAGYYDRNGYPNMYAGPTNWSIMPLNNSVWPDWVDGAGDTCHQCPLSATHNGLDGRTTRGHVDDYWREYGNSDPDPFDGNWTEHTYGDCTGDFMKTNQTTNYGNSDGGTSFYSYGSATPLTCAVMRDVHGIHNQDGTYGFKLFYESRGYTVDANNCYMQKTDNEEPGGFSFADYMAEIDAGFPVMFHVTGHTMVGVGYNSNTNQVILHDTWNYNQHAMTWGGSYSGMDMWGVSIVRLVPWEHNSATTGNWNTGSTWDAGTVPTISDDVTIREDHTVTLDANAQVRNLTIQYGATLIIPDGVTLTVEENLYNNGLIQQTRDVPTGSTTEFFHIQNAAGTVDVYHGVDITPDTTAMGSTIVQLRGNHTNGCTNVEADALVNRCVRITPGSQESATIRFWFTEDERNAQDASGAFVWHYDAGSWTSVGSSLTRSESGTTCTSGTPSGFGCYVEAQGISTYSPFGVGSGIAPTAITMQGFDAQVGKEFYITLFVGLVFTVAGVGALLYRRRKN